MNALDLWEQQNNLFMYTAFCPSRLEDLSLNQTKNFTERTFHFMIQRCSKKTNELCDENANNAEKFFHDKVFVYNFLESKADLSTNHKRPIRKSMTSKWYAHFEEYKLVTGIVNVRQNVLAKNENIFNFMKNTVQHKFYDIESV